jgi:glutathione S-transferase
MKLYANPISTCSLPILLFLAEHETAVELVNLDIQNGEQFSPEFTAVNPNNAVPAFRDGNFVLTECSAILKYLADSFSSPSYPEDLRERARVNEAMDWFNTGFYRDMGYGVVYPQINPAQHGFSSRATQSDVMLRGDERSAVWFSVLNNHWLSNTDYCCGSELTLADYLGSCFVAIGDWVDFDMGSYPNVMRWMARMKARPSWAATHGPWDVFVVYLRSQASLRPR